MCISANVFECTSRGCVDVFTVFYVCVYVSLAVLVGCAHCREKRANSNEEKKEEGEEKRFFSKSDE